MAEAVLAFLPTVAGEEFRIVIYAPCIDPVLAMDVDVDADPATGRVKS